MDDPYAPARGALAGEGLGADDAAGDGPKDADPAVVAARLDDADPLSAFADRYRVPDDVLYMDGNSLGPASDAAFARLAAVFLFGTARALGPLARLIPRPGGAVRDPWAGWARGRGT